MQCSTVRIFPILLRARADLEVHGHLEARLARLLVDGLEVEGPVPLEARALQLEHGDGARDGHALAFKQVDIRLHGKGDSKLPWRKAGQLDSESM